MSLRDAPPRHVRRREARWWAVLTLILMIAGVLSADAVTADAPVWTWWIPFGCGLGAILAAGRGTKDD